MVTTSKNYHSKISVNPRDPVLFSISLRFNLEPANEFEATKICNTSEAVKLKSLVEIQDRKIDL